MSDPLSTIIGLCSGKLSSHWRNKLNGMTCDELLCVRDLLQLGIKRVNRVLGILGHTSISSIIEKP